MLNYSTHAIEDIDFILQDSNFKQKFPVTHQMYEEVKDLLHRAVKFELPSNGTLVRRDKCLEILEPTDLRLPFPIVALEYTSTCRELPEDTIPAPKRIALCLEYEGNEHTMVASQAGTAMEQLKCMGGIIVLSLYYSDVGVQSWCLVPWGGILPRGDIGFAPLALSDGDVTVTSKLTVCSFPSSTEMCDNITRIWGEKVAAKSATMDMFDEVMAVINMIGALSCSNVAMQQHAAPNLLNKKRIRKGKKPFYDYRSLVVSIDVTRNAKFSVKSDAGTGRTIT